MTATAKFTLPGDKTEVTETTMRVGGRKRLHLVGVGGNRKDVDIISVYPSVADGTIKALFDGPKGIWSVDIEAKAEGTTSVLGKHKQIAVAMVKVTVKKPAELPAADTEAGLMVRLLLSESRTPSQSSYSEAKSKTGMQWMRLVLVNRLKNNPAQFGAPGATKIEDIVKAKGQFAGFEKYPKLDVKVEDRIKEIIKIANDDNHKKQAEFDQFFRNALEIAEAKETITDPSENGLYGWRTAGSGSPGSRFEKFRDPLSGNQFYTLKRQKD